MHETSFVEMGRVLERHLGGRFGEPLAVLDVGAMIARGGQQRSYRDVMPAAWRYTGCDLAAGPNVDLVQIGEYRIQEQGGQYDVVISGQCLEHVRRPWLLAREMGRMLKPGGWAFWTAPWRWRVHRFPLDCWRVLPDGMAVLLEEAGLDPVSTGIVARDCWGVGRKQAIS